MPQASWSGQRPARETTEKHRWQTGGTEGDPRVMLQPRRRLRRRVLRRLTLLFVLLGAFVYALLYAPVKTPVITVAATDYHAPVPPNAWALEDVAGLAPLHQRTIDRLDGSAAWRSPQRGLEDLERKLREVAGRPRHGGAIVVYLSLHGLVDEAGTPCLLPPAASPLNRAEWLPVEQLLERLAGLLPPDADKLLVLDCQRLRANWSLGLLHNTFAERLETTVARAAVPRLTVLTSAGPGEVAGASADLRGSAFGRFFALGLAGAADRPGRHGTPGGNGDGYVSTHELHAYVRHHVDRWSRHHRAESQSPQRLGHPADFRLTLTLPPWTLRSVVQSAFAASRDADAVPPDDLAALWQQLEAARASAPFRTDPLGWRDLEQQLLALEQLASSGAAYHDAAKQARDRLAAGLAALGENKSATASVPPVPLHSLALAEHFGQVAPTAADQFRDRLQTLAAPDNRDDIDDALRTLPNGELLGGLLETQLLRLCRRHDAARLWPQGDAVRRAVQLRERFEQFATRGDDRAQEATRLALEPLDDQRRQLEDRLLAGPSLTDPASAALLATFPAAFETLASDRQSPRARREAALATSDRVWSQLPYLAAWSDELPPDQKAARDRVIPLVRQSHQLTTALAHGTADAAALSDLASEVAAQFEQVAGASQQVVDELLDVEEPDAVALQAIERVLRLPLLPTAARRSLREKASTGAARLHGEFATAFAAKKPAEPAASAKETTDSADDPVIAAARARWERQVSHEPSWLLLLLKTPEPPLGDDPADTEFLEEPGASALPLTERETLGRIERRQGAARTTLLEIAAGIVPALPDAAPSARQPLAEAERRLRAAAALGVPRPSDDPIERLRRFDRQQLLLWHAGRILDDFWALPASGAETASAPAFFDTACSDYLAAARWLLPPRGAVETQFAELEQRLNRRRVAARRGWTVTAEASLPALNEPPGAEMTLRPGLDSAAAADAVPPGLAALVLRRGNERLSPPGVVVPVPPPADGHKARVIAPAAADRASPSPLVAATLFRGHEFSAPVLRQGLGGLVIRHRPYAFDAARITVYGDRRQQASTVFILDCSWSMREELRIEAQGAETQPRIEQAKAALQSMLTQLAQRGDARVGVRFFGHRLGWTQTDDPKAVPSPSYAGPIPDDLGPSEDVELILPLGRFEPTEAAQVAAKLKSVRAWGQSPLYLALRQTAQDFATDDVETDKSIVVITDGANYQFTPANSPFPSRPASTLEHVKQSLAGRKIPVYIVGFGVTAAEAGEAERAFTSLAKDTGGQYFSVTSGADLVKVLRQRLQPGGYLVNGPGRPADAEPTRLNVPAPVKLPGLVPQDFAVKFEAVAKDVTIEGGEALELFVNRAGDLVSRPYERDLPVAGRLVRDGGSARYVARVHRPVRQGEAVAFPVSIQDDESHFTRRPTEAWIEVTPDFADGAAGGTSGGTYPFYDANFEPNEPVPVLRGFAAPWPAGANRARVQAWYKFERSVPALEIPLAKVAVEPASFAVSRPVPEAAGVSFRLRVTPGADAGSLAELQVIEEHGAASAGVRSLRVLLESPRDLRPEHVTRQFDAANNLVVHTFVFAPEVGRSIVRSAQLVFTTRAAALDGAWHLENDRPLSVEIFSGADVLPLDAATGARR